MNYQSTAHTKPAASVTVLSVSPLAEDHFSLETIFSHSKKTLHKADSLASALAAIRRWEIGVVVCERDLRPGTWVDLLEGLRALPDAPPLIVTSRLADERLWAEALNLGAFDVLAKPFEIEELVRGVNSAWLHWRYQREVPGKGWGAMRAAC